MGKFTSQHYDVIRKVFMHPLKDIYLIQLVLITKQHITTSFGLRVFGPVRKGRFLMVGIF